jgi:multidrug resistance protein
MTSRCHPLHLPQAISPTLVLLSAVSAAVFADSLLYSAVVPVLPEYADRLGASPAAIGLLFAAYAVALLVVTPIVGSVADRIGHRTVLLVGMVGVALATLLFAASTTYPMLLTARLLQGAAAGAVWTSGIAVVAARVEPSRLGVAMGFVLSSMSAGLLVGPPVTGNLVEAFGFRTPFLILAAVAGACALLGLLVPRGRGSRPASGTTRTLLADAGFRHTLGTVVLAATALTLLEPLLPLHLGKHLGAGAAIIGLVFGAATLAHLVASPLVGALADRYERRRLMAGGLVAMAVVLPGIAAPDSVLAVTAILVGFAIAYSFVLVPALPEIADRVRELGGGYAPAYAAFNIAFALGMVIGPTAGSALATTSSLSVVLAVTACLLLLGGLWHLRHRPPTHTTKGALPCLASDLHSVP